MRQFAMWLQSCSAHLHTHAQPASLPAEGKISGSLCGESIATNLPSERAFVFQPLTTPSEYFNSAAPPNLLAYFLISDCDSFAAKAKSLGASFIIPPSAIEGAGRFAVLADPQGAVFALFEPSR